MNDGTTPETDDQSGWNNSFLNGGLVPADFARKLERERNQAREERSNLLARIHRDGGHYESLHGTAKAVADADAIIAKAFADLDELSTRLIKRTQAFNEKDAAQVRRINELEGELEREQTRLAACGVVALADTPESASASRDMLPEHQSASCSDVARRVDECISLRSELAALRADKERLDWLEDHAPRAWETGSEWSAAHGIHGNDLREAIDSARSQP